ncbi:LamG-like jellyroll fold domain-containing protein [Mesonia aquimarina]|uniref:LamG-like jellyroll fold domain-containing protein n=1 Tax=Mesonia aquimarina TaxID=1504967 RepID=UPI0013CE4A6E|nr:LamG-like jellyroll fold domain-containing protein [Mesonia aquimarina]
MYKHKNNFFRQLTFACIFLISSYFGIAQTNQYLHFDGVDDFTELPNAAQYVNNLNTITMAGWFYTDELIYGQGMMSIRGGGTGDGEMYIIQLNNGKLECRVITSTGLHQVVTPDGIIQAGVWQHIAWVFNEDTLELFIDGVSVGTSSASGTFQSNDRPFSIGKSIQSGFNFVYKGRADEVSLWSKALSVTEIEDMIANELDGNETGLEVYYKFNQGTPGGNNTNISQLFAEGNSQEKNATLNNFSLTGENSNFNGELESGFQAINFNPISNKLTTDAPFALEANVNSGLPISFEVVSGPASINQNMITLDGNPGEVTIKASQAGNEDFDPAEEVFVSFQVLDPQAVLAETEILHPLNENVYAPNLIPLKIAVKAEIEYPELFSVDDISAEINGETVTLTNHENGYYTGWWTPTAYGTHEITLNATNNYGASDNTSQTFNLVENTTNQIKLATDEVWVNSDYPTKTVEAELPSYIGAFDQIIGTLYIDCPSGGCDPWDRISSVEAQGKDGEWYEIIRYLTPYGVSCQSEIDLTDFSSLLQGKTKFRVNLGTQGNGFLYTLELNYQAGIPNHPYSSIRKLWYQTYQFGDMANLQPTENITANYPANTETSKIKLVSSGHGWGENNTANAAEFLENTHHIWVNGEETFTQHNWNNCDPNPDNCSPQAGTWYHDRAGWCPGTIAQFFDYDMNAFSQQNSVELKYVFDESYVDFCHPNNPDCISGSTCTNCDDGFNPHLIVSSYLISFGNSPMEELSVKNVSKLNNISLYPNPSTGKFYVNSENTKINNIIIYDYLGRSIKKLDNSLNKKSIPVDLSNQAPGVYLVSLLSNGKKMGIKKVIIE